MNEVNRLIFKIELLKKVHDSIEAINIKKLEIHPGTIYALVGPPGIDTDYLGYFAVQSLYGAG